MKKVKSWVCLILTAAMLLVLPACGGNGETADSDSANSASGETYTWRIAHNNAEDWRSAGHRALSQLPAGR